jgi:drug/metabolite transporter (DMT)-like permease
LLIVAFIWGANIPVTKYATSVLDPFVFNAARMLFSVAVLALGSLLESRWLTPQRQPAPRSTVSRWHLALFVVIAGFIYQIIFLCGITRTSSGNTALILSSMPMWTAAISAVFVSERLPGAAWLGLCITFVGTAIVIVPSGKVSFSSDNLAGNLLMLAAAVTWAGATVMSRPLLASILPLRLAFLSCLASLPLHLMVAASRVESTLPAWSHAAVVWSVLYSGILSTGLAYVLWHTGVRQIGASHASAYQNLVTLIAFFGGWVLLHESPTRAQIIGGMMIVAGLLVVRRSR